MDNGSVRINDLVPNGRNSGSASAGDPRRTNNLKPNGKKKRTRLQKILLVIAGLVVLLGLAAGGWFFYRSTVSAQIDSSEYQAVFFTNGQVYFGKLHNLSGGYYKLTGIFYLETKAANSAGNPQSTSQSSDVQLTKLGNEIHGPVDEMVINRDQVLFFENLKKDGKVTTSIDKYNSKN